MWDDIKMIFLDECFCGESMNLKLIYSVLWALANLQISTWCKFTDKLVEHIFIVDVKSIRYKLGPNFHKDFHEAALTILACLLSMF